MKKWIMFFALVFVLTIVTGITAEETKTAGEEKKKEEKIIEIEIKKGWTLSKIAESFGISVERLVELNDIENLNLIYAGQKIKVELGNVRVSWYGPKFHGRLMANGKVFDMNDPTVVVHRLLPFGTKVRLTRLDNKKSIIVKVQDRGPYIKGRHFDISHGAAILLDMIEQGVVECKVEILEVGNEESEPPKGEKKKCREK